MDRDELQLFLSAVRRRWVAVVVLRTASKAAVAAGIPILAALVLDRVVQPQGLALVTLAGAAIFASLAGIAAVLWRMPRRPDDRRVARFIEERAPLVPVPPFNDALVSAIDRVSDSEGSSAFRHVVVANVVRQLRAIAPAQIVSTSSLRSAALAATAGTALFVAATVLFFRPVTNAIQVAGLTLFPGSIRVEILPGNARIPAGQPLRVRASVRGWSGALTRLVPSLTVLDRNGSRGAAMAPEGNGFSYRFDAVNTSFRYRVTAGSFVSPEFSVAAVRPPRVLRVDVQYAYPTFTGLAPRSEKDTGDIYGPAGTRVRVRVHADKPVAAGALALTRTPISDLRPVSEVDLETELVLARDDSYRIRLSDREGLRSNGDTEYFIRIMDDRPPEVRMVRPASDQQITPLEEVAIEARADDDYGIAAFDLVYSVAGGEQHAVPFSRLSGTAVAKIGSRLLAAEELRVQPGDVITYYARARDVARAKRSTESKSDIFFLEVRPFSEEFVAAQSQAIAGAAGAQIESLIAAQKEIITATWNLERRAAAGRSAEDVKAVSRAQVELKARLEQMMLGSGSNQVRLPQQVRFREQRPTRTSSDEDPIAGAINAMGKAVQQLDEQQTTLAIPHEMAALQRLLQAQAEITRRQVAQQANGASSGGAGRQGQDLSALFDKELQRQQRTNYETRSQIEERPDTQNGGSALDRIRDLARRQEDLSRRMRELAASGMSEEERKRQLEKLTREQTELRQQAEDLARQTNAREGGRGQQNRTDPAPGGSEVRQASDSMRSAASELRRQETGTAAESGSRAAQQLRQLEQRMSAGAPNAADRARGNVQLEAQQIAQEQRRISGETARLDKGSAGADARRRLAGDKEALADRVDGLQKTAEHLGKQSGSDSARGAAEAARDLQQQHLGQRIRESAKGLRDQNATPAAAAEEQITRALDRVADKLRGVRNSDARQLSEQLGDAQAVRARLDDLERRIRDAEAKQRQEGGRGLADANGARGARGQQGSGGSGASGELQRLREEYARELQKAREMVGRLQQTPQRAGNGGSTPEQQEPSLSAPGNEAFKQDYAKWESLRKDINVALERQEAAVSDRLAKKLGEDRLNAGGSDRVPDAYRPLISRYYELLARTKK